MFEIFLFIGLFCRALLQKRPMILLTVSSLGLLQSIFGREVMFEVFLLIGLFCRAKETCNYRNYVTPEITEITGLFDFADFVCGFTQKRPVGQKRPVILLGREVMFEVFLLIGLFCRALLQKRPVILLKVSSLGLSQSTFGREVMFEIFLLIGLFCRALLQKRPMILLTVSSLGLLHSTFGREVMFEIFLLIGLFCRAKET